MILYLKSSKGLTILELMIAVSVIGILATIASGSFLSYQAKAKQTEAKNNLGSIAKLADTYYAENDTYDTDWDQLGWSPEGTARYRYWYNGQSALNTPTSTENGVDYSDTGSSVSADGSLFTVAAVGNIDRDLSTDQVIINQSKNITILQNDVITN